MYFGWLFGFIRFELPGTAKYWDREAEAETGGDQLEMEAVS